MTSSFVIDASCFETGSDLARAAQRVYAPGLIDLEIANVLRKTVLRQQRTSDEATKAFLAWLSNDIRRVSHRGHAATVWELRHSITPYDAAYVALAMHLGLPLLTGDRRLAAAASAYCEVEAL